MDARDQQRETLEEEIRVLESVYGNASEYEYFDDARLNGQLVTAPSATRAALNILRGEPEDTSGSAL